MGNVFIFQTWKIFQFRPVSIGGVIILLYYSYFSFISFIRHQKIFKNHPDKETYSISYPLNRDSFKFKENTDKLPPDEETFSISYFLNISDIYLKIYKNHLTFNSILKWKIFQLQVLFSKNNPLWKSSG